MFTNKKKSNGIVLPSWLTTPGTVVMNKHMRQSKCDPLVEGVQLSEANPEYAVECHDDGHRTTVSLKHLAPRGNIDATEVQHRPARSRYPPKYLGDYVLQNTL
ncbi:hypothetical protein JTB14_004624 [Gonioctena quinquepunctata]|nr:hypothetical protein JTB14_004624 [Gonioctena quinquepunctata]